MIRPGVLSTIFSVMLWALPQAALATNFSCQSLSKPDIGSQILLAMELVVDTKSMIGDIQIVTTKSKVPFLHNELSYEMVDDVNTLFLTGDQISLALELAPPYRAVLNPLIIDGKTFPNLPFVCTESTL